MRGATDDSYGIEVAKLAGVPAEVIRRAKEILAEIETEAPAAPRAAKHDDAPDLFTSLRVSEADAVADKLRETDLNTLTPIEAMNFIFTLKKMLSD